MPVWWPVHAEPTSRIDSVLIPSKYSNTLKNKAFPRYCFSTDAYLKCLAIEKGKQMAADNSTSGCVRTPKATSGLRPVCAGLAQPSLSTALWESNTMEAA
jgi:hypothetical protein